MLRDAKFQSGFPYFVFEQVAQGLDDFFEVYTVRQASHVVVGLDDCGFSAKPAFYHVRVDGSLHQEVYRADLLGFFFEYADEFFPDDFTFCLRL